MKRLVIPVALLALAIGSIAEAGVLRNLFRRHGGCVPNLGISFNIGGCNIGVSVCPGGSCRVR